MEYITNKRGEQVTFDEFITWPASKQTSWARRGEKQSDIHQVNKSLGLLKAWAKKKDKNGKIISYWKTKTSEEIKAIKHKLSLKLRNTKRRNPQWANTPPEEQERINQKRRETIRAKWQDPEYREKQLIDRRNRQKNG